MERLKTTKKLLWGIVILGTGLALVSCLDVRLEDVEGFEEEEVDAGACKNCHHKPGTGERPPCDRCHGFPPPDPHPQSQSCSVCHGADYDENDHLNAKIHMNGEVD